MAINTTTIKSSINLNLPSNNAGLIVATIMRATLILLVDWIASVINAVPTTNNIAVNNIENEALVTHTLESQKLSVSFFANNRQVNNIDWEPVSSTQIRVYLPYSDTPVIDTFTGEIFIIKRV